MKKVHVRRFFIHVHHRGNDIFRSHKIREKGLAFLKEASGFFWRKTFEKSAVRGDDKPAHMHGILSDSLAQLQIVNAPLDGLRVSCRGLVVQFVVVAAALIVDIRVGMALAFTAIVTLNVSDGLFLELVHMQDEIRHGRTSLYL